MIDKSIKAEDIINDKELQDESNYDPVFRDALINIAKERDGIDKESFEMFKRQGVKGYIE